MKPEQVTTNVQFQMISNQIASEPLLMQWVAKNKRIPSEEERQQLLAEGVDAKAAEPSKTG